MRPSSIRTFAVGFTTGALLVAVLGTPTAKADTASDYAISHGLEICGGLMRAPSVPGVMGSFVAAQQNGLSGDESARAVTFAVLDTCPQHVPELERFIAIYTQKGDGQ